jgi:tRNA-2-methylthio-N6-dimethylallyladenosine synthase
MDLVEMIKKHLGDEYALSSDFIVGFPGETDDEFKSTIDALKKIRFSESFTYAYSPRNGTKSFSMDDNVPHELKISRLNELITLQRQITSEFRKSRTGRKDRAIVEKSNSGIENEYFGKTSLNDPVIVKADTLVPGTMVDIEITGSKGTTLFGSILKP